ncbi:MAG: DUF1211 domain-containing protein [Firmicutes bacterium]|nr:DUF1211 domain-containing protein [Bacillota bacterium]
MKKERVAAFTDAVLAIIMTILVLELEKPTAPTISALWELRYSFFSYALSFFWLGSMWINIHNEWESIEKISAKTLWVTLILLFFCSVIPYATDLVSKDFNNSVTQGFYGIFVILVTLSNIWLSKTLDKADGDIPKDIMVKRRRLLWIDIAIKVVGFMLSVIVYPPAMMYSVIIAAAFLMTSIVKMKLDWSDVEQKET